LASVNSARQYGAWPPESIRTLTVIFAERPGNAFPSTWKIFLPPVEMQALALGLTLFAGEAEARELSRSASSFYSQHIWCFGAKNFIYHCTTAIRRGAKS
jgi:hypothetical protein